MIENIKSTIDELTQLKKEFELKEKELVSRFDELGAIGLSEFGGYRVQLDNAEAVINIADGQEVIAERDGDLLYPYELTYSIDGVTFFTLLNQEKYEEFKGDEEDAEEENSDSINKRPGLTQMENDMLNAGHKWIDFE